MHSPDGYEFAHAKQHNNTDASKPVRVITINMITICLAYMYSASEHLPY